MESIKCIPEINGPKASDILTETYPALVKNIGQTELKILGAQFSFANAQKQSFIWPEILRVTCEMHKCRQKDADAGTANQ